MLHDAATLKGLLEAYADGDLVARRALLDWLEEHGDPRLEEVRDERVDWDRLAAALTPYGAPVRRSRRRGPARTSGNPEQNRMRWLIDCARFGSEVQPHVAEAVRAARLAWLRGLFPEAGM